MKKYPDIIYFAIVLVVSHFLWKWLMQGDESDTIVTLLGMDISAPFNFMVEHIAKVSTQVLNFFGFDAFLEDKTAIVFPNRNAIRVVWGCSAIKQSYIFVCIIAFYRGSWLHKLWYIPAGLAVVYLFNIFRICALAAFVETHPEYFEFLHGILLKLLFYGAIFGMWVLWNEIFVKKHASN